MGYWFSSIDILKKKLKINTEKLLKRREVYKKSIMGYWFSSFDILKKYRKSVGKMGGLQKV